MAHSALLLRPENGVTIHQPSCPTKNLSCQTQPCPPISHQTLKLVSLGIPDRPVVGTRTSIAEGWDSVPGEGTKILQAAQHGQKQTKNCGLHVYQIQDTSMSLCPEDPVQFKPSVAGSSCPRYSHCHQTGRSNLSIICLKSFPDTLDIQDQVKPLSMEHRVLSDLAKLFPHSLRPTCPVTLS